jgi:hypothetical protein
MMGSWQARGYGSISPRLTFRNDRNATQKTHSRNDQRTDLKQNIALVKITFATTSRGRKGVPNGSLASACRYSGAGVCLFLPAGAGQAIDGTRPEVALRADMQPSGGGLP